MRFAFSKKSTPEFVTLETKNGDAFEVQKINDINPIEDEQYQLLMQKYNLKNETQLLLDLASKISREEGVTGERALKIIIPSTDLTTDEEKEEEIANEKIRGKYVGDIVTLNNEIVLSSASSALFSAFVIINRMIPPLESRLQQVKDGAKGRVYTEEEKTEVSTIEEQIEDIKNCTLEDIKKLPRLVVLELARFFREESSDKKQVEVDEESGKSSSPRKSKSLSTKDKSLPTGEKSIGESSGTGPMTKDLVTASLVTNPDD